jgi:hypothetical protein
MILQEKEKEIFTMAIHEKTIALPAKDIVKFDELMSGATRLDGTNLPRNANIATWSVVFDDGVLADIRVNTGDDEAWCECVLLDPGEDGEDFHEIGVSEVRDSVFGIWRVNVGNERYIVYVVTKESTIVNRSAR